MRNRKDAHASMTRRLSLRIILRFLLVLGIYYVLLFGGALLMSWLAPRIAPLLSGSDSPLVEVLHRLYLQRDVLFIGASVLGVIGLPIFFWVRTLGYLRAVVSATQEVFQEDDAWIQLPRALTDAETQLNQIKLGVRSARTASHEAEQRKNDLVVYLAHDLKTPLTSVIGYLSLLRDEPQLSEALRERYLSIALDKAERLEELINEFFEITRFNLSHIELELAPVDLSRMLEQVVFESQPLFAEKRQRCELDAPPGLTVRVDAEQLRRVLDNLLTNAARYGAEDSDIRVEARALPGEVCIRVANHGITIPPDKLERIFERFYRLDSARSTHSGGAGLGLAIAKQIIELHGGTIRAESENEQTTFICRLPGAAALPAS